jgi:hypothetical protein
MFCISFNFVHKVKGFKDLNNEAVIKDGAVQDETGREMTLLVTTKLN